MRSNNTVGVVHGSRNGVTDTSRTANAVAITPVMCTGLPNACDVNGIGKAHTLSGLKPVASFQVLRGGAKFLTGP